MPCAVTRYTWLPAPDAPGEATERTTAPWPTTVTESAVRIPAPDCATEPSPAAGTTCGGTRSYSRTLLSVPVSLTLLYAVHTATWPLAGCAIFGRYGGKPSGSMRRLDSSEPASAAPIGCTCRPPLAVIRSAIASPTGDRPSDSIT